MSEKNRSIIQINPVNKVENLHFVACFIVSEVERNLMLKGFRSEQKIRFPSIPFLITMYQRKSVRPDG